MSRSEMSAAVLAYGDGKRGTAMAMSKPKTFSDELDELQKRSMRQLDGAIEETVFDVFSAVRRLLDQFDMLTMGQDESPAACECCEAKTQVVHEAWCPRGR